MKLSFGDLNPDPYPPRPTSTYTCEVTITPMVYGGTNLILDLFNILLFILVKYHGHNYKILNFKGLFIIEF